MLSKRIAFVALSIVVLASCGGQVKVYRGTVTQTTTGNGNTATSTQQGASITTVPGVDSTGLVILYGGQAFDCTVSNGALTFAGGQTFSSQQDNFSNTITLTTGSGSLNGDQLSITMTLTESQTQAGQTATSTITFTFSGTRQ